MSACPDCGGETEIIRKGDHNHTVLSCTDCRYQRPILLRPQWDATGETADCPTCGTEAEQVETPTGDSGYGCPACEMVFVPDIERDAV